MPLAVAVRAGAGPISSGRRPDAFLLAQETVYLYSILAKPVGQVPMLRERKSKPASTPRSRVAISFGSPAGESGVTRLDLNEILIRNPQAAFLMRIAGSSMRDAGIDDGDLALVDRALEPSHGQVVIAVHRDDLLCRRLCRRGEELGLQSTDPEVPDVWASEGDAFDVWGVVTHVVKQVSN